MQTARSLAYDILKEVIMHARYSNLELNHALQASSLSDTDKGLVTTIVYGTIQRWHLYHHVVSQEFTTEKVSQAEHILLAMSWYQAHFLERVPDYAIVNEAVDLAKHLWGQGKGKFINALLRRLMNLTPPTDPMMLARLSHPQWMVKMLESQWGSETAAQVMMSELQPPIQHVRVNRDHPLSQQAIDDLQLVPGHLSPSAFHYHGSLFLPATTWFQQGIISMQDEASQGIVQHLHPQPHERILDVCAAPGSKSCQMAELSHDQATIVSVDIHPHRVNLIEESATRLGLHSIHPLTADATKLNYTLLGGKFDKILLDAPCSGLGVIRRKPDVLLKPNGNYMDELLTLQMALLDHATTLLKDDGILVYSTCTWNRKENEKQVDLFLKRHSEFELVTQQQILGPEYDTDAFYMAQLRKRTL